MADSVTADDGTVSSRTEAAGCACGASEEDLLVVYDRNFDYPWKGGNPYARLCPDCGSRTFTARSYWESQEVPYVIVKGGETPQPLYDCPYDDCDGSFLGTPSECPDCEQELLWGDDEGGGEDEPDDEEVETDESGEDSDSE